MSRPPQGAGVTYLFSRLMQPSWDVLVFSFSEQVILRQVSPWNTSFSEWVLLGLVSLLETGTNTPHCPTVFLGSILISSPFLIISTQHTDGGISLLHICAVSHLTGYCQDLWESMMLHGQIFGSSSQLLDGSSSGCIRSVSCYHGPHIGCQFMSWVFSPFHTDPLDVELYILRLISLFTVNT